MCLSLIDRCAKYGDEKGLRDVVIMDSVDFFVMPATRVICKHSPNATDDTVHHGEVHEFCKKHHNASWERMVPKGVGEELPLAPHSSSTPFVTILFQLTLWYFSQVAHLMQKLQ